MAAKLINCTKEEQHSVIRFLWAEGVPGAQIHLCMCAQYGDKVLSHRIVYEWTEMFDVGRSWNELRFLAADRQKWKEFTDNLCSQRNNGHYYYIIITCTLHYAIAQVQAPV